MGGEVLDWPFPDSVDGFLWRLANLIIFLFVGIICKIILTIFNKLDVRNVEILTDALSNRPDHVPLLTVMNHASCFDDPGLWSLLPWKYILSWKNRWALAAHDICFTKPSHSQFFAMGKCIPVIRGAGVYQQALDFSINLLNRGDWVHIFPEGRVNEAKEFIRFKWGIGRLIAESQVTPIVIPIYHIGMDTVLPNVEPYRFKWGNYVLVNIGQPIDLTEILSLVKRLKADDRLARKMITDKIQQEFFKLKEETEKLYCQLKPMCPIKKTT